MNGFSTTSRSKLFFLASKGEISGCEKIQAKFFSKRALNTFSNLEGGWFQKGHPAPAALKYEYNLNQA